MANLPPNLLNHAKASQAQIALMELAAVGKSRKGKRLPLLATFVPVVLACGVVFFLSQAMEDHTGVTTKRSGHLLLHVQSNASEPEEI